MMYVLVFSILLWVVLLTGFLFLLKSTAQHTRLPLKNKKTILLIAVRNEEKNLPALFVSLEKLIFPTDNFEVWFGNDRSEDTSEVLIQAFCAKHSYAKFLNITHDLPGIQAKQNVLAQLINKSQNADYYLVTDADITHHSNWAVELVSEMHQRQLGVVSGITIVNGNGYFAKLQGLDWLFSATFLKVFADLKMPITAIGNNMGFTNEAYKRAGGYENLPFSVTEDFLLFAAILKAGFKQGFILNVFSANISAPASDVKTWFRQRKRWLTGGLSTPWYTLLLIVLFVLSNILSVFVLVFYVNKFTISLLVLKTLIEISWLIKSSTIIQQRNLLLYIPFYYFYVVFSAIFLPVYFILPGKINWKGRNL